MQTLVERTGASGFIPILPLTEAGNLYQLFPQSDLPYTQGGTWTTATNNQAGVETRPPFYVCASDTSQPYVLDTSNGLRQATGSYAFVHGSLGPDQGISDTMKVYITGMFVYKLALPRTEVRDGTNNTMIVGETYQSDIDTSYNIWTQAARHESSLPSTVNPLNTLPG